MKCRLSDDVQLTLREYVGRAGVGGVVHMYGGVLTKGGKNASVMVCRYGNTVFCRIPGRGSKNAVKLPSGVAEEVNRLFKVHHGFLSNFNAVQFLRLHGVADYPLLECAWVKSGSAGTLPELSVRLDPVRVNKFVQDLLKQMDKPEHFHLIEKTVASALERAVRNEAEPYLAALKRNGSVVARLFEEKFAESGTAVLTLNDVRATESGNAAECEKLLAQLLALVYAAHLQEQTGYLYVPGAVRHHEGRAVAGAGGTRLVVAPEESKGEVRTVFDVHGRRWVVGCVLDEEESLKVFLKELTGRATELVNLAETAGCGGAVLYAASAARSSLSPEHPLRKLLEASEDGVTGRKLDERKE